MRNANLPQTKLKKNLQKINDLEQNSILNVSAYLKKLQTDSTDTIENFTPEQRKNRWQTQCWRKSFNIS